MSIAEGEPMADNDRSVADDEESMANDDRSVSDESQNASDEDQNELSKGARSLCQVALECSADAMLKEPNSYDLISNLPWKLQQDLWKHLLDDRRERQRLEEELATRRDHLIDWELDNSVDRNYDFITAHPEDFLQGSVKEDDSWSTFLDLALGSSFPDLPIDRDNWDRAFMTESSTASLIRFKIGGWGDCPEVDQLISADLMRARMAALKDAPACDKYEERKDGSRLLSIKGVLLVEIEVDTWSDEPEPNSDYVRCTVPNDSERRRIAELYINALLSPIDLEYSLGFNSSWNGKPSNTNLCGRNAFARRALKEMGFSAHEDANDEAWEAHRDWERDCWWH
ncbi:uncharacterized protein AB675_8322 [Cyphellophora attinorum]|uniref:Uncharacterized protein n=1 Tax=Cyphellophora attinorum TaxID=1664694 RepID=A0A0N1HWE3_9EURO|nr:uncharacterized protein AB675_8322 [Phialophora attinorum]KPI44485.1 hypothetical protein AB675_8322 [Phialophora attinorum]